jgi:hypothetical protein
MGEEKCNSDNLEQYAGEVIKDPWQDPNQTDWKTNLEGGTNGVGTDTDADQPQESDQRQVPSAE